jgi:uncharacterized DUF497 family protein
LGNELRFQWDGRKAARNVAKHDVTFDEAASAFGDPLAAIFDDEAHSGAERREILVGYSAAGGPCWWHSSRSRAGWCGSSVPDWPHG